MRKVILTTGGTGGHIYPALTLAKELKERGSEILFVGTKHRMEKDLVPEAGYEFLGLDVIAGKNPKALLKLFKAFLKCKKIVKKEKPEAIIGFGNYISIPMIMAGLISGVKVYLHEQNVELGLANKLFYRFAHKLFVSFEETFNNFPMKHQPKVIVTGNPIRESFFSIDRRKERENLKLRENEKILLIVGGSLGAKNINDAVINEWERFFAEKNIRVYWATGKKNYTEVTEKVTKMKPDDVIKPYFENMANLMAAADMIISRGGASTISEIIEMEKPSIIIPYDYVGQYENAKTLADIEAAELFDNSSVAKAMEYMFSKIKDDIYLQKISANLKKMKKGNATQRILRELDIWRNK
jgi:UDP-N-acetylglucosamine--N-acetylmuramyl-(pentapeptide) pyrophosphoryl-undecaprenol N-acetylglucosamine transferase